MDKRLFKIGSALLLGLSLCLSLCACSTTSETFDCPSGKGVGCKSISEVNQMVDQGVVESEVEKGKQSMVLPPSIAIMATDSSVVEGDKSSAAIPLSDAMAVHRVQEEHLRVWIAPFQDEQGNLHEGSVIHTVLKPGYWQLKASPQKVSHLENIDIEEVD